MGTRAHLVKSGVGLFGLAAIFGVLHPLSVRADTVYVAPGGSGDGSAADPFGSVQTALENADPGDQVSIASGTYSETVETVRDGEASAPIVMRGAGNDGPVVLTASGRVVRIDHAHVRLENLTIDGQYGDRDAVDVNDGADGLVLRNVEIRRSGRDCLDMGAPSGVLIEDSLIHHCLDSRDGRTDAHGITGGAVTELTVRNTEIHTFSGDGLQFDPGRELPGWNNIVIEGCLIWLAPLAAAENGFAAGTVPGENGVDTKTNNDAPRADLVIRDSVFYGFSDGMISNMAALNLKENVDVEIDRVTLYDSQIALRLRGPTSSRPAGAWVRVANTVIYRVEVAVRYEDDIENLRIWNTTIGAQVDQPFVEAAAENSVLDVRNLLVLAATLPVEAPANENLAVGEDSFVDPAAGDHHLAATSAAIDSGNAIAAITWDRDGLARPQGAAIDIGAYEWCGPDCEPVADPDGSVPHDASGAKDGASSAKDGGADGGTDGGSASSGHGQSGCSCRTPARTPTRRPAVSMSPLRNLSRLMLYGLWFLFGMLAVCLLRRPK